MSDFCCLFRLGVDFASVSESFSCLADDDSTSDEEATEFEAELTFEFCRFSFETFDTLFFEPRVFFGVRAIRVGVFDLLETIDRG